MPRIIALVVLAALFLGGTLYWRANFAGDPRAVALLDRAATLVGLGTSAPTGTVTTPADVKIGGPFHLVDETGRAVTDADYRGRWTLIYFGYTYCPDVCPTELAAIAAALGRLGEAAPKPAALFITVDPERDTPPVLTAYLRPFGGAIVGLTGSKAEIDAVTRVFRVYYAKISEKNDSPYTVDHSSFIYLMDPDGHLAALFSPDADAEAMAGEIRKRMSGSG